MMCKSKFDLSLYGDRLSNLYGINNKLYISVLNKYYREVEYHDIWLIDKIHDYCNEVLDCNKFINSELYYVITELYDLCEWIILWYGGEYDNLKEIYSKQEFIDYVKYCIENTCCEINAKVNNL